LRNRWLQPDDECEAKRSKEERNREQFGPRPRSQDADGKVTGKARDEELRYYPGSGIRHREVRCYERAPREQHKRGCAPEQQDLDVSFAGKQKTEFHEELNASDVVDGRYRLERLLGTGGMAEVWLAEDTRLGRWVAVKALHLSFAADGASDAVLAFEREARVIARLQHANIVGVYDTGTHEDRRYIVMEYVHGYSLRQLLETQGRLTEAEAIRFGAQVANALAYSHAQGVIHCDIKPENILITEAGVAKIADFGVAETLTRTMAPGQAQDLLGTVAYLAPEVIEGAEPSPASDVYSLALTIYELVAGRLPFSSATSGASLGQRLATPAPPLRAYARGASTELETVLSRALSISPLDRHQGAAAFATALQRVPNTVARAAAPVAAPPGRPPQLQQRRQPTARVNRGRPAPASSGPGGYAILMAVGVVLAALGVGIAAAVLITRSQDKGGTDPTPTPGVTVTQEPTREPSPPGTPTRTATVPPSPSPSASPSVSATPTRTPTRTPTPGVSPTAQPTQTPQPSPTVAATVTQAPTATATP